MKKRFAFLLCVILILLFFWNQTFSTNPLGIIHSFKAGWGIDLPVPGDRQELWSTDPSFNGDGEWINVFHYKKQISPLESGMVQLTVENFDEANEKIQQFIDTTISICHDDQKENIQETIKAYPIQPQIGDYYFYSEKNEGYDYFIALYQQDIFDYIH